MQRRELLKILSLTPALPLLGSENSKKETSVAPADTVSAQQAYDLVVYGGTPGGVALAVRAAREGLTVMLVNYTQHLGGIFSSGLGTMDTLYNGARAPLYDEYRYSIYDYYRSKYGKDSPQYEASLPGFAKTKFESHVAELLINRMVEREDKITVTKGYYPVGVKKNGRMISSITFKEMDGTKTLTFTGKIFADCSYEGDLLMLTGTEHRIGRESKDEFNETHAGITYTQKNFWPPPSHVDKEYLRQVRTMNVYLYDSWSELIFPESTGAADKAIQAFNFRTTLTNDPNNRVIPGKPKNYDREYIKKKYAFIRGTGLQVPNQKTSWNYPEVIGEQNNYVEGDWKERKRVMDRFREDTLAVLYFKQNDPSVPEEERKYWKEFGLSRDEYPENGHIPYELYVREARRLVGYEIFTQHDGQLAEGLKRAPVHADSISITEWFMDSHACTDHEIEGSKPEGEVMLKNFTFPGQVSFGTIFPKEFDNFIVPVCLSSTHVGWGTIRLEPTWMSICEAAGYVVAFALRDKVAPYRVDRDKLLRTLAEKRVMLTFFNDVEGREYAPWYPAMQYLGTKGYFGSYDASAYDNLSATLADAWISYTGRWVRSAPKDPTAEARKMLAAEDSGKGSIKAADFAAKLADVLSNEGYRRTDVLALIEKLAIPGGSAITRGDACRLIYEATRKA